MLVGWALGLLAVFLVPWLKTVLKKKWLFYLVLLLTALPGLFYCTTSDYYTSLGMMIGFLPEIFLKSALSVFKIPVPFPAPFCGYWAA